jgi:VanZ family protein
MTHLPWLRRWLPALGIMVVIFIASSIPAEKMPSAGIWDTLVKKSGHMAGYALLALSLLRTQKEPGRRAYLVSLAGCLLYAASDEFHQSFVAGRNASIIDVGIDLLGAALGVFLLTRIKLVRRLVFSGSQ